MRDGGAVLRLPAARQIADRRLALLFDARVRQALLPEKGSPPRVYAPRASLPKHDPQTLANHRNDLKNGPGRTKPARDAHRSKQAGGPQCVVKGNLRVILTLVIHVKGQIRFTVLLDGSLEFRCRDLHETRFGETSSLKNPIEGDRNSPQASLKISSAVGDSLAGQIDPLLARIEDHRFHGRNYAHRASAQDSPVSGSTLVTRTRPKSSALISRLESSNVRTRLKRPKSAQHPPEMSACRFEELSNEKCWCEPGRRRLARAHASYPDSFQSRRPNSRQRSSQRSSAQCVWFSAQYRRPAQSCARGGQPRPQFP